MFAKLSTSLTNEVRELADVRHEWVTEQEQWTTWRAAVLTDEPLAEIKVTFDEARHSIDTALRLIIQQLR